MHIRGGIDEYGLSEFCDKRAKSLSSVNTGSCFNNPLRNGGGSTFEGVELCTGTSTLLEEKSKDSAPLIPFRHLTDAPLISPSH